MKLSEYFETNRYAYLSDVLSKEVCAELTAHMFNLKEQGQLVQDPQCPLSWSIYGDEKFDRILNDLAEPLSQQLGIQLLPTYTYARIYQSGEILKRHVDRESCEISGTLTLGHDPESEIWPIHFSSDPKDQVGRSVKIDVGDMIMYRGNELNHWRPVYIGRWQTQVFFHFVDANGPHATWAYDKRSSLGTKKDNKNNSNLIFTKDNKTQTLEKNNILTDDTILNDFNSQIIYNGVMIPNHDLNCPGYTSFNSKFKSELIFTKKECEDIISYSKNKYPEKATVGTENNKGKYKEEVRRVEQYLIDLNPKNKWIFDKLANAISIANHEFYQFEIMGIIHGLQLLHYKEDEKSFYDWHTDTGPGSASKRKLSIVVALSDKDEYEGGELIINNFGTEVKANLEQGSIHLFPSYLLHKVTPVTKGNRWVLVIWIHGSRRFM